MRKLLFGLAIVLPGTITLAQSTGGNNQWTLLTTDHNVSVFYENADCGGNNMLLVRIVNNNDKTVTVNWTLFDGTSSKTLELKPNETITGECTNRMPMARLMESIPAGKSSKDVHGVVQVTVKP